MAPLVMTRAKSIEPHVNVLRNIANIAELSIKYVSYKQAKLVGNVVATELESNRNYR